MYETRIEAECSIKAAWPLYTYLTELLVDWHDLVGDPGAVCFLTLANLVVDGARQVHQLLVLLAVVFFHGVED